MRILVDISQTNKKLFVTFQPKNTCKLELTDHLWITYRDEPQSDIVVFTIINFQIYNILVQNWKHGIVPKAILPFNGGL